MKDRFIVYGVHKDPIISRLSFYMSMARMEYDFSQEELDDVSHLIRELLQYSVDHGYYGNLWHCYLTHFMICDENPFSLACERNINAQDHNLTDIVVWDLSLIRDYFGLSIKDLGAYLGRDISRMENFDRGKDSLKLSDSSVDYIAELSKKLVESKDSEEFMTVIKTAYATRGVGEMGLHKAFRITDTGEIIPINRISNVMFKDLVGLKTQKQELRENTEAFITGRPANNCLLYGDAGTGKSSSIKALANEYYNMGLRIVEVYKHQLSAINDLIANLKQRNYKFIIYMDDLSFEENETEYKYLKALIEGGLEKKPDNILIYATSNRRHIVRESFESRNDDVHVNDTLQEKLSLFARFGVTIYFGAPGKQEYSAIVLALKSRTDLNMSDEEILALANSWEMSHGGRSGRTARQLIDHLLGSEK